MTRYGWLTVAAIGWAVLVGVGTAIYARWSFARRGWTAPLRTRAFDRSQQTQSSFEEISRSPVRMPEPAAVGTHAPVPDADRIMIRALSDDFPMVRREAVRVLGEIGSDAATKALTEVSAHDTSSEVREEAIAALAEVIRRRNAAAFEDSTG